MTQALLRKAVLQSKLSFVHSLRYFTIKKSVNFLNPLYYPENGNVPVVVSAKIVFLKPFSTQKRLPKIRPNRFYIPRERS